MWGHLMCQWPHQCPAAQAVLAMGRLPKLRGGVRVSYLAMYLSVPGSYVARHTYGTYECHDVVWGFTIMIPGRLSWHPFFNIRAQPLPEQRMIR